MSGMKTGMTIGKRLALAFGAVLALMVGVTAIGMHRVVSISSVLTSITDVNSVKQRYAINFRGSVHDRAISLRDVVLVTDGELAGVIADITRLEGFYAVSAEKLDQMFAADAGITQEEKDILASIKNVESTTQPIVRR
jgi:methyl-accepting chemotaxis protein